MPAMCSWTSRGRDSLVTTPVATAYASGTLGLFVVNRFQMSLSTNMEKWSKVNIEKLTTLPYRVLRWGHA